MGNTYFFQNGITYKKYFYAKTAKTSFDLCLYLQDDKQFVFGLGGNSYKQINLEKKKYHKLNYDIAGQFSIQRDNYNIVYFNCSNNQIEQVQIGQLWHLESIDLSCNKIKYLFPQRLQKLIGLNLHRNLIQQIDLSKNLNLKYLDLSSNKLTNIDLSQNKNLINVDLSDNNIQSIQLNNNIQYLDLGHNRIEQLQIPYWSNLRILNISSNFNLKKLVVHNKLQRIICYQSNQYNIDISCRDDVQILTNIEPTYHFFS